MLVVSMLVAASHAASPEAVAGLAATAAGAGSGGAAAGADGLYSKSQAQRGEATYKRQCASCHFDDLGGDDCAPPLTGPLFYNRWNGLSVGDMFESISVSMPVGAPSLKPDEYVDIISYLLGFNGLPAGGTSLPVDGGKLKNIKLQLPKPTQ